ncbi:MAG: Na+/H+ antiporter NhaC family protein [Candidatus Cryptobacteroides sp.]
MGNSSHKNLKGWLALSPLAVFLVIYLLSSVISGDFYSVPVASAFLLASCYALLTFRKGGLGERISIFSEGAGDKNVLLMIWIFVLAGVFAQTAKDIGAIDATVNLTLRLLPGNLIFAGLFLASCFISMSIGTSVGTIVALVPVATGLASGTGSTPAFMAAIVTGGAFFGDNLSFISDTTIAATKTQGCTMKDKFRTNIGIAGPAALVVTVIYILAGQSAAEASGLLPIELFKLVPYLLIIILAISGMNVIGVLAIGIAVNAIIGFCDGSFTWGGWLGAVGKGIGGMGELIIVTMLAGGMLEIIRRNGGINFIIELLTRHIKGRRGAELSIAALVSLANLCTANNTIAIITTGPIAKDISSRFGVNPKRAASILDTFSCLIQGIIPYGAQLLMASGLAGVRTLDIIRHLYYPPILGLAALLVILLPRRQILSP